MAKVKKATPKKAAVKLAKEGSDLFHNIMAAVVKVNPQLEGKTKKEHYSLPVEQMEFPTKLQVILKDNGINTLKELASYDAFELMHFNNMGVKCAGCNRHGQEVIKTWNRENRCAILNSVSEN